jgi:hypothetical protein
MSAKFQQVLPAKKKILSSPDQMSNVTPKSGRSYGLPNRLGPQDICEAMGTRADNGELVGTFGDFAVTSSLGPLGAGRWEMNQREFENRLKVRNLLSIQLPKSSNQYILEYSLADMICC